MGSLSWYDIHAPGRRGHGCLEVEGAFIKRTSPAYRWAVGLNFEELYSWWESKGFHLVRRFEENCKSFGTKRANDAQPRDTTLFSRISESESFDEVFNLGVPDEN